jgi:phage baseplate assembly protein V
MIERLAGRLANLIAVGRLKRTDVSGPVQTAQVDFARHQLVQDGVPLLQQFGFASRPPAESDVVAVVVNGEALDAVIVASGSQAHRPPALAVGDSALYDANGQYILLNAAGGTISAGGCLITMAGGVMTLKADKIITDGLTRLNNGTKEVARSGDLTTRGDTLTGGAGSDVYA